MKMKERNEQLKAALGAMAPKERVKEVLNIPKENTVNRQGYFAYSLGDELRLVTMLNTLKIQPQFYRSESQILTELRDLIERIGTSDPYFVAQAIVYSRCMGEGMRSINHLAAALVSPFIAGKEYARRFYGAFDKKNQRGGCIFRLDDMTEIKDVYCALNKGILSNAMKKGFASVLESADTYALAKYKKNVIDLANLVHPNSEVSNAVIKSENGFVKTLDALMRGIPVTADTWEAAQSEAGQEVAKAVREGKIDKNEAEKILAEAKADNWEALLKEGKLPIMAALRNIRNIMKNPREEIISMWCKLISDEEKIRKGLLLPCHFDLAYTIIVNEFNFADYSQEVQKALIDAYQSSIPNLKEVFTGKTCVIVDCSGSMGRPVYIERNQLPRYDINSSSYKAGLIAATIVKAVGADVIRFGSRARYFDYDKNTNVFALAKAIGNANMGATSLYTAFELMRQEKKSYDRLVILSDYEINSYNLTSDSYKHYIHDVASPYIYCVDLAAYGTAPLMGDKISFYYGYGSSLYEDIKSKEFNAANVLDKIRKIVI